MRKNLERNAIETYKALTEEELSQDCFSPVTQEELEEAQINMRKDCAHKNLSNYQAMAHECNGHFTEEGCDDVSTAPCIAFMRLRERKDLERELEHSIDNVEEYDFGSESSFVPDYGENRDFNEDYEYDEEEADDSIYESYMGKGITIR